MKKFLLTLGLILLTISSAIAMGQPAIVFSQEVVALNADGSRIPPVVIEPENIPGIQRYDFDLGKGRLLRVETNLKQAKQRGLLGLAETVRRCYNYVEAKTGRTLARGTLLYLVELEDVPYAYNFSASYDDASKWGEVRLALVKQGTELTGLNTPDTLTDLLYDTLPHELGHDILMDVPALVHDVNGKSSQHTRWFIEGICETLAKGFSKQEDSALHRKFLALRNVDTILADAHMEETMLNWAQHNENNLVVESDLYGAAMLTMMAWTEKTALKETFEALAARGEAIRGQELVDMMRVMTGYAPGELMQRANLLGKELNQRVLLARLN